MATIQEQFGQAAIDALVVFCRADIRSVADLQANEFSHVANPDIRSYIAQTFYGARWLNKLGLTDQPRMRETLRLVRRVKGQSLE